MTIMRVLVDGVEVPLADDRVELPLYRFSMLRGVEGWREGAMVEVDIASTQATRELFGHSEELYRTREFNGSLHRVDIEVDGVVLFSGVAILLGVKSGKSGVVYCLRLRAGGAEWADSAAKTQLSDTAIVANRNMVLSDIIESWRDGGAVRMLPLRRDSYAEEEPTGLYVPQQPLLTQDYHPFISVSAIVDSIAQSSGYQIVSSFLSTPLAKKLMISGAYKRVKSEQAYASMGFKALRTKRVTAQASQIGRVDAWITEGISSLGAIVDTVNPNSVDDNGNPMTGAYDNGGCFTFEDGVPTFTPKREIGVAFDVHLRYTTDYRIVSSSKLRGFDKIYLGNECYVEVGLCNHFRDYRHEVVPGVQYRLFIFDYDPAKSYWLDGVGEVTGAISTVSFKVGAAGEAKLLSRASDGEEFVEYSGDWALYEGYVEETGRLDVNVTIRTPNESLSPTSPKVFKQIYFYGADEGQCLTLHAGCSIVPIFGGAAGYGDRVEFKDVANHDITQADLLEALSHLFNLCIYTHNASKRIYIEPYDDFFAGAEVDWRDRELEGDVVVEESAVDSFYITRIGYQPSDGATKRLTTDSAGEFGVFIAENSNYAAKQSVKSMLNPVFSATASMTGAVSDAPSAAILTVGDRDIIDDQEYVEPRIVLYHGMEQLPQGEVLPMGGGMTTYPLVAFHAPQRGETLCFEDRDGCVGLHRFYDNQLSEYAMRQMVTLNVSLSPMQYVALFDPDSDGATIRSRFRLQVGGNSSLFRLEEIVSYDAVQGVARCRFQRVLCD